jgi:EmrB/QacA subfamily drug resistance transporter
MTTRRLTLAVVCIATAMLMLDIAVVNTALPDIGKDLHTGLAGLQWVVDAYTLALATVVLSAGALADRLGRRKLFTIGLGLFTASSLACTLADTIGVLEAARAVQGIGAAIMFAVSLAILANAFPGRKERATALAAYGATIGASFAVGPLVGGALTSGFGWRSIFLINVPIGLLALAITRAHVTESRDPAGRKIDWAGQLVLAGGLFLLVLALLRGNQDGWGSTRIVAELAGAAILLVAFVIIELRAREPMLPMSTFRNRSFTAAQIGAFAISGSFFAVFLYSTLYLQNILHLSPIEAGLAYMPGTVVCFVVSGASAQLGERGVSMRRMVSLGLALVAGGMLLMTLAGPDSSWTIILPGSIVALIGTGLFNPSISNVALSSLPEAQSGLAAGVNDTFRQAGIAVGIAALGALIPAHAALGQGDPQSYVTGLQHALIAGAGLAAAGAVATGWLLGPRRARASRRELAHQAAGA